MKPRITDRRKIILVGMDFYGKPLPGGEDWSEQNAIGKLWARFNNFLRKKKNTIEHLASESGYELWVDSELEEDSSNNSVFVGLEVNELEDVPIELGARILPETKYAVYTFKGEEIKSDWPSKLLGWVAEAGLKQSYTYIFEYYDSQRFKGMDDASSELDVYVPVW